MDGEITYEPERSFIISCGGSSAFIERAFIERDFIERVVAGDRVKCM
jgi:hypothetical protein